MNRCPHMPEVQDWLDGTLTPEAAARFEAHLAGCAECEAEAAATRSLTDTSTFVLGSLGSGFARLGEALSGGSSAGRMWKLLWGALAHPEVMLTVLAAVAVCAGVLWWMRPRDERETGEIPH